MSDELQLRLDRRERLVYTDELGIEHPGVEPVRAFPFSDAGHWIALVDEAGRELRMIDDAAALPAEARELIARELARREFVPRITRIVHIARFATSSSWDVVTDRGETTLAVKSEEDVRRLGNHRALVTDAQGIRYLIDDIGRLDATSRRLLDHYL